MKYEDGGVTLIHGDFFDAQYRDLLLDAEIDCIISDPPFNVGQDTKVTKKDGKIVSNAEAWGAEFQDVFEDKLYDDFIKDYLEYSFAVLENNGSLVSFIDDAYAGVFIRIAEQVGFKHKKNLHFVKVNCVPKIRAYNYATAVEVAVWLVKPKGKNAKPKIFNYQSPKKTPRLYPEGKTAKKDSVLDIRAYHNNYSSNVFFYNTGKKRTGHPCEKYQAVVKMLIETHTDPGTTILDPFAGGFNIGLTAKEMGRNYIGFELVRKWFDSAKPLMKEIKCKTLTP